MNFDINQLELGELEDIEEVTGINPGALEGKALPVKMMTAIAWVLKRRDDPAFTLEQARRIKVVELLEETPSPNGGGGLRGRDDTSVNSLDVVTSGASRRKNSGR